MNILKWLANPWWTKPPAEKNVDYSIEWHRPAPRPGLIDVGSKVRLWLTNGSLVVGVIQNFFKRGTIDWVVVGETATDPNPMYIDEEHVVALTAHEEWRGLRADQIPEVTITIPNNVSLEGCVKIREAMRKKFEGFFDGI